MMTLRSHLRPTGSLHLPVIRGPRPRVHRALGWRVKNWLTHRWRELPATLAVWLARRLASVPVITSALRLRVLHGDGSVTDLGVVSRRVVTTAGVNYIVDAFQNTVEVENMKYHGFGTGTGAEASGDTAHGTEMTTQYATDNTRPTGTTTEGASANIYRTVATFSPDSGGTIAITEHGVFSATSSGTLLDRSVFSAVNVVAASDSIQSTYEITFSAGS